MTPDTTPADAHCPADFDGDALRSQVLAMYRRVAERPAAGDFHFHVGAAHAVQRLGYDAAELARLPVLATERFAGVGRPLAAGPVPAGAVVLDHACGAGTDLLLAVQRAGPGGRGIGVDLTPAMCERARQASVAAGLARRVEILNGSFDRLALPDASVDLALSNGVLNLATDKRQVLRELWRVLRPGAALYLADVVLGRALSPLARRQPALWAACVGGALTEAQLLDTLGAAGFVGLRIAARHRPYAGTSIDAKFGRALEIASISLAAHKPR